jgi:TonB family protein
MNRLICLSIGALAYLLVVEPCAQAKLSGDSIPIVLNPSTQPGHLDADTGIIAPEIQAQPSGPIYPSMARRLGEQGEARLKYVVTTEGNVEDIAIVSSSGHADLDAAAIKQIENSHWKPAIKDGTPVAVQMQTVVAFKLQNLERLPGGEHHLELYTQIEMPPDLYPAAALAAKEEGVTSLEVLVGTDGSVVGVSLVHSSGSSALDKTSEEIAAKRWHYNPLVAEGRPTKAITLIALIWRLPKSTQ